MSIVAVTGIYDRNAVPDLDEARRIARNFALITEGPVAVQFEALAQRGEVTHALGAAVDHIIRRISSGHFDPVIVNENARQSMRELRDLEQFCASIEDPGIEFTEELAKFIHDAQIALGFGGTPDHIADDMIDEIGSDRLDWIQRGRIRELVDTIRDDVQRGAARDADADFDSFMPIITSTR